MKLSERQKQLIDDMRDAKMGFVEVDPKHLHEMSAESRVIGELLLETGFADLEYPASVPHKLSDTDDSGEQFCNDFEASMWVLQSIAEANGVGLNIPLWTPELSEMAIREGWNIFESAGSENGDWQVQVIDNIPEAEAKYGFTIPPLREDKQAWRLVHFGQCEHHAAARAFLDFFNPVEAKAIKRAFKDDFEPYTACEVPKRPASSFGL